jgi:lipopolysaccharide transport system permease protein
MFLAALAMCQRCLQVTAMTQAELVITPPRGLLRVDWRELWRYRDLFVVLAWRDIAVRYKQTLLGVLWAVLQPVVTMAIFTLIFNRVAKIQSGGGSPYPVFIFVGLVLWQYFSNTLTNAANSMITNANLIQKVYFPRLIVPMTSAIASLADLGVAAVLLAGVMAYYGIAPRVSTIVVIPVVLVGTVLCSVGAGLFLSALNVKYRDVRYALPFVIQTLLFVTPVIYPVSMLQKHPIVKAAMLWLNPMSGLITSARACLLNDSPLDARVLGIAMLSACIYACIGIIYFRSTESYFADIA